MAPDLAPGIFVAKLLRNSIVPGWLSSELGALLHKLDSRIATETIVPGERTLKALTFFPVHKTRVVILGQDPYPQPGKATGLCFGVDADWAAASKYVPDSSIANIIKELKDDTGETLSDLRLEHWARQGVLMLNTRLSVAERAPMSHAGLGWEEFTGGLLRRATELSEQPVVVVAWGAEARRFAQRWVHDPKRNMIISSAHPCRRSASRGFFGSKPFSLVNSILADTGKADPIVWGG